MSKSNESTQRPLMTRARLTKTLKARFGTSARGHVDVLAVATEFGVSTSTIYRWMRGSSGRAVVHMPAARVEQLEQKIRVDEEARRGELQQVRYAEKAIRLIAEGRPNESWAKQRWTEPHRVLILQIDKPGIRQIASTRVDVVKDQVRGRGRVINELTLLTRFHATVLIHQVLVDLDQWRCKADSDAVRQGYTQAWLLGAPAVHLKDMAKDLGLLTREPPKPSRRVATRNRGVKNA